MTKQVKCPHCGGLGFITRTLAYIREYRCRVCDSFFHRVRRG